MLDEGSLGKSKTQRFVPPSLAAGDQSWPTREAERPRHSEKGMDGGKEEGKGGKEE